MGMIREQAVDGCLMTYGASIPGNYRQTASYVANVNFLQCANNPAFSKNCSSKLSGIVFVVFDGSFASCRFQNRYEASCGA
jgi:hypothetical protein